MREDSRTKWSNEELIDWIKSFKSSKEMRNDSYGKYCACLRRGLNEYFPSEHGLSKYTDEFLIEWISGFSKRSDMKRSCNAKYQACLRRGLDIYFPDKVTRGGFKIGWTREEIDRLKSERKSLRDEKKRLSEERKRLRESRKILKEESDKYKDTPSKMYKWTPLENGNIICGRCFEESKPSMKSKSMCVRCYKYYMRYRTYNKDFNKWNVRDEFCNTTITHHEKVFNIGVRVDERTQNYLTLVGYSFLFKDVYIEE